MKSRAAVFVEQGKPLSIESFDLPRQIEPGAALCKVCMSTICGSDLHTIFGRRQEPTPLILGHESIGRVVALGEGLQHDRFGDPLRVGDRVTWSVAASCGNCFACRHELPQKCDHLRKYGHTCCKEPPHLTGGYAEHIYLFPGTAIFRVPDGLPDAVATPANCALSTMVNALETIGLEQGETVLIQGAGLLGLNLVALCREAGAGKIFVTDVAAGRLEFASRFGADACFHTAESDPVELIATIRAQTGGHGVDVAFEVCGAVEAVGEGIRLLRIGGRYLIAGLVTPGSALPLEGNQLTRNCLTIKGIHNYRGEHLGKALRFLDDHGRRYPYDDLLGPAFALDQINQAVQVAASAEFIRVAIKPDAA